MWTINKLFYQILQSNSLLICNFGKNMVNIKVFHVVNGIDFLPLRRNEPIDFRHLPVKVAHNLVLLLAGRDGQQNGFHLAISGCPQIRNDAATIAVVFFRKQVIAKKIMGIPSTELIAWLQNNIDKRNRSFKVRYATRTFSVRTTIDYKIANADFLAVIAIISFCCRCQLR